VVAPLREKRWPVAGPLRMEGNKQMEHTQIFMSRLSIKPTNPVTKWSLFALTNTLPYDIFKEI
jgi:hypothetical protein